ncbi:helicase associated domain-containing protein [Arthrobacter sp. Soc17.1.1.1]|uniref:helicase associated domain-containing protein n=1 Tax=Arthrobacter sp. Soc17.1.1.1 TaxID=3121277 RepID=UPI002FE4B000
MDRQIEKNPDWFDACLLVRDQPAWDGAAAKRFARNRDRVWWQHYADVAAHMGERGGVLPAQNDRVRARELYRWIEAQRRQHDAGNLTQDRIEALDGLGEWRGTRRGNPDALWASRLEQVRQFHAVRGRFPVYTPQRRPEEKVLATWLHRQRTWSRAGRLRQDRHQQLDQTLPGWTTPTR